MYIVHQDLLTNRKIRQSHMRRFCYFPNLYWSLGFLILNRLRCPQTNIENRCCRHCACAVPHEAVRVRSCKFRHHPPQVAYRSCWLCLGNSKKVSIYLLNLTDFKQFRVYDLWQLVFSFPMVMFAQLFFPIVYFSFAPMFALMEDSLYLCCFIP